MAWRAEVVERLADVAADEWNALDGDGNPFVTHAFLEALEAHGCVGGDSGWSPRHLLLRDGTGRLAGAVPRYEKAHSWGEFVFDWSWAQSYARAGLPYYPKQLAAVPFTPVTGPRLLVRAGPEAAVLRRQLAEWLVEDGGTVKVGQPLYSLELDKSVQEIESPASGTLKVIAPAGEVYEIGALIAEII